jgi:7-cyano-7-deazaguanine synthase
MGINKMRINNSCALVLLSGGQDSTTCLYWAKSHFDEIVALNIVYGQRHAIERQSAEHIAKLANVEYGEFDTDIFKKIGNSALIEEGDISTAHPIASDLPASFVPGRNIIFLTIAAMMGYKHRISDIITGVCQADAQGYPDCREQTIKAVAVTLSFAMNCQFNIHTPLMYKTKAETVKMAMNLPGCMEALSWSHSCYEGAVPPCGKCPSCIERAKGFEKAGIPDPLVERLKGQI